jgi:hypothetical protein
VIWQPYLLAVVFGLAVSAGIYAAFLWPRVEPQDDDDDDGDRGGRDPAAVSDRGGEDGHEDGDAVRATD